jgi:large subunit ribosomal protein L24
MKTYHVKKGDKVVVNAGKWKGEEATIAAVLTAKDRVVLELANVTAKKRERFGKKTVKKSQANPNGGLIERSVSVHVSNVNPAKDESPVKEKQKA